MLMRLQLFSLFFLLFSVGVLSNWTLTFSDEFNNISQLNTSVWNTYYSFTGVINQELEYYTLDAFSFTSTDLQIVQNNVPINATNGSEDVIFNYTSGVMTTKHKYTQTYGYFEMRAQVPQGIGFWPAFWLLPETDNAVLEIDIVEMIMNQPDTIYTTFHCNYSTGGATGNGYTFTNFSTGYHIFGLQWYPENLIWYVDGLQVFNMSSPCVPNVPEYIITNVAIGGDWPEPPNNSTPFPSSMNIDYIRAYEYVPSGGILIDGPGVGVGYTPNYGPPQPLDVWNPIVTPETASPGDTVTLTFDLIVNSADSYPNLNLQFPAATYTENINGPSMLTGITVNAGSPTVLSLKTSFTIPSDMNDGYIKIGLGVFNENWSSTYFWESDVWALGVNMVVGA